MKFNSRQVHFVHYIEKVRILKLYVDVCIHGYVKNNLNTTMSGDLSNITTRDIVVFFNYYFLTIFR